MSENLSIRKGRLAGAILNVIALQIVVLVVCIGLYGNIILGVPLEVMGPKALVMFLFGVGAAVAWGAATYFLWRPHRKQLRTESDAAHLG